MERLVKIEFPCHTLTVCSGSRPYICYVGFHGELHFLSTVRLFSEY